MVLGDKPFVLLCFSFMVAIAALVQLSKGNETQLTTSSLSLTKDNQCAPWFSTTLQLRSVSATAVQALIKL